MLRRTGHKAAFQSNDGYLPQQRPTLNLESLQLPALQLVRHESARHRGYTQASAYQALDCVRSPHVHCDSWFYAMGIKPARYQGPGIGRWFTLNEVAPREIRRPDATPQQGVFASGNQDDFVANFRQDIQGRRHSIRTNKAEIKIATSQPLDRLLIAPRAQGDLDFWILPPVSTEQHREKRVGSRDARTDPEFTAHPFREVSNNPGKSFGFPHQAFQARTKDIAGRR